MSQWTAWSACSVSCGLGSLFRQRDILREALPSGACGGAQFDSRSCFPKACPVNGHWSEWTEWSECDTQCGGGVRQRNRTCSAPPPKNGGLDCKGMTLQSQSCNSQPCTKDISTQTGCVNSMVLVTEADCHAGRVEPCPPTCSHLSLTSNCTAACILGCRCPDGLYLQDGRCVNASQCVCLWDGRTLQPGQTVSRDQCTTWSQVNPAGAVRIQPCAGDSSGVRPCSSPCLAGQHGHLGHSVHQSVTLASKQESDSATHPLHSMGAADAPGHKCRQETATPTPAQCATACYDGCYCALGFYLLNGSCVPLAQCPCYHQGELYPADVKDPWSAWSECSVTCGGGYRSRTRGPIRIHGTTHQFSACNLQPCGGGMVCPPGQKWKQCVTGAVTCTDLTMDLNRNCTPGCQCPNGTVQQDGVCVRESNCRCDLDEEKFKPGDIVPLNCNNCTCEAGKLVNCSQVSCSGDGGWSQWSNWTECTKSCGGGVRSRRRECDSPHPEGEGNYCEGRGTDVIACNTDHCPVAPCTQVPGTVFSSCGPSCPRSCDDLAYCEWQCEPGCYCTGGKVLSANGTVCVAKEDCPCMELSTGQRLEPGETTVAPDGSLVRVGGSTAPDTPVQCQVAGASGQSGLHAPGPVDRSRCPATGAVAVLSPKLKERPALENRKYTMGSEFKSRDSPALSSPSVLSMVLGVPGQRGQSVMGAPGRPFAPESVTALPLGSEGCPVSEKAGRAAVAMTMSLLAQTVVEAKKNGLVESPVLAPVQISMVTRSAWTPLGADRPVVVRVTWFCRMGLGFCGVNQSLVVMLMVAGANGGPGPSARSLVEEESSSGDASVITRPLRAVGEAVLESLNSRKIATYTCAQTLWARGSPGLSGLYVRSAVVEDNRAARASAALYLAAAPVARARPATPKSASKWAALLAGCTGSVNEVKAVHSAALKSAAGRAATLMAARKAATAPCTPTNTTVSAYRSVHAWWTKSFWPLCRVFLSRQSHLCSSITSLREWNFSLETHCFTTAAPVDGGLSPWGPWSPCSLSCGGLGLKSRFKSCTQPAPAHGGRDCQGPRQETTYCQAPDCPVIVGPTEEPVLPDEDAGFSSWSLWSPCTKTCTDALSPAMKSRHRQCVRPPCSGSSHQEKACNLPLCSDGDDICVGTDCVGRNCSWTEWGEWSFCSRSCGVGQQQRIRAFIRPQINGSWCEDILGGNLEHRFCNIRPCRVDGGWSRWSPWSRCDKGCGGGRSIRTRSCSSPPPKNGGKKCEGEKNQVKPCNTKPCDEKGCPLGQEFVVCANQCPQRCSDLQQGIECYGNTTECQPGCRCPKGLLQQDEVCVQLWQCDCVDSLGQIWAAGSWHQVDCNNCSCSDGQLFCTNNSCQATCVWSSWSSWALCSVSCGQGQRTRYRSLIPETEGANCHFEEVQHKNCDPGPCPPLCLHDDQELRVGDTWLQGECKQCTCSPEGNICQGIDCRVDGGWTPWSVWSDCSVTCSQGAQVRTRACINPPPRNNGTHCSGPDRETQDCHTPPCLDDLCPWSPWSPCSQSCGAGSVSRRRVCVCEEGGDAECPTGIEVERNREETQLCYHQPCPGCPMSQWSVWSQCSCVSQRQQRYRVALSPATRGQQCTPVEIESKTCSLSQCGDCEAPLVYSACGEPCEKQCALQGQADLCLGVRECTPGCYCPQGMLQQNGSCVPSEECGCVHLQHHASGQPPTPVTVPQGATVTVGCSTCLCHGGTFQCDIRECEVIISEWSEWTPCSPCVPFSFLQNRTSQAGVISGNNMVSVQRRFRACLDLDSGLPVSREEEESQCPEPMVEERLCPDVNICKVMARRKAAMTDDHLSFACAKGSKRGEHRATSTRSRSHARSLRVLMGRNLQPPCKK
ncbi:hypothetical protein FQN60_013432, partial [Etheostoma spectabile]